MRRLCESFSIQKYAEKFDFVAYTDRTQAMELDRTLGGQRIGVKCPRFGAEPMWVASPQRSTAALLVASLEATYDMERTWW